MSHTSPKPRGAGGDPIQREILDALRQHDGQRPIDLRAQCPTAACTDDVRTAARTLLAAGHILNRPRGNGSRYFLSATTRATHAGAARPRPNETWT